MQPLHPAAEVNSLTSSETELPYNYYTLPFCKPPEGIRKSLSAINPGTILMGSRIENSAYNFSMLVSGPARCAARSMKLLVLCSTLLFYGEAIGAVHAPGADSPASVTRATYMRLVPAG